MKNAFFYFLKVFAFLGVLSTCNNVVAQKKQVLDSLKRIIKSGVSLEERAKNYNKLAISYYNVDLDSAIKYANQSVAFSSQHKLHIFLATAHNYLGQFMYAKGNYQLSLSNFEMFKSSAIKAKNEVFVLQAINNAANVYLDLGRTDDAIRNYEEVLTISKAKNYKKEESLAYANLSYVYRYVGDSNKAIKYLFAEIEINETLAYDLGLANAYQQLALIYMQKSDFKNAKQYLDFSLNKFRILNDLRSIAINYNLFSSYYLAQDNLAKAIEYGKLAIDLADRTKDKRSLAIFRTKLAEMYFGKEDYKLAETNYSAAISLHEEINLQKTIAAAYIGYGRTLLELNDNEKGKINIEKGLEIAIKQKSAIDRRNAYEALTEYYIKNNEPTRALKYQKVFNVLKDSLLNETSSKQVNELNTIYKTEKNEKQIILLSKENRIKQLQLLNNELELDRNKSLLTAQQQELTINGLELANKNQIVTNQKLDAEKKSQNIKALKKQTKIQDLELKNKKLELEQRNLAMGSILVVFLALGGISFSYYKRNKLKQQNLLQTEIYKQQEIATKSVFEGEQNERIRIARDLHDGIGQMLSVVKMNVSTLNPADKTVEGTLSLVDKTITELRAISHNLIPEALNFGLFAALEDICQKINEAGKTQVALNVAEEINDIQLTQQNKLSIYRIVQEVLNNMIKHANASHISIDIKKVNENMLIAIKDDGDGFDTSKIDDSKGIGWKNISARVHLMDGDMNIKSEKLIGTQIEISIPA